MTTVVLAAGDLPGGDLVTMLGAERTSALAQLLRARAGAWVRASFPEAEVRECDGGLAEAVALVLDAGRLDDGPVVIAAPELGVWRDGLGQAALEDLDAGCALSFGPVFDGGLYLLALSPAAQAPLRDAPSLELGGRAALIGLVTLAGDAGIEVGMLRTERGLRTDADIRALLADPLTDSELRQLLE